MNEWTSGSIWFHSALYEWGKELSEWIKGGGCLIWKEFIFSSSPSPGRRGQDLPKPGPSIQSPPVPWPTHPGSVFTGRSHHRSSQRDSNSENFLISSLVHTSSCHRPGLAGRVEACVPLCEQHRTAWLPEGQAGTWQEQLKLTPRKPRLRHSKCGLLNTTRKRKLLFMGTRPHTLC